MTQWLWNHKQDTYDMIVVFANTGEENEETLLFVEKCSNHFGFPIIWVECKMYFHQRKTGFHITDFPKAHRHGEPFENMIKKHGIPNQAMPHCTRELKQVPIRNYAKSIGWKDYYLAIGIRGDEADRMNAKAKKLKIIYPLISKDFIPMDKPGINHWWQSQSFRLNLRGYQGNCKTCWKKGDKKLYQIAKESPQKFEFMNRMEREYGNFVPKTRLELLKKRNEMISLPIKFFRKNRSTVDILNEAMKWTGSVIDDTINNGQGSIFDLINIENQTINTDDTDLIGAESCEVFSECNS